MSTNNSLTKTISIFEKNITIKLSQEFDNRISLWCEYDNNIIYTTVIFNKKNLEKKTHFTVYYKECIYANIKNFTNKKESGKTDKEILMSRTIDRSLRSFIRNFSDFDITLTVMLMQQGNFREDITNLALWSNFILMYYLNEDFNGLYGEKILSDGSFFNVVIKNNFLVMLEGNFTQDITQEEIYQHILNIREKSKVFSKIYEEIDSINLLKKNSLKEQDPIYNKRSDGRKSKEIRPLNLITNPLKGQSALFTRGKTSVLGILGISYNESVDISLNYKFHPFSVGESGETFGNSRREKGHGHFVKMSLSKLWKKGFSYKIIGEVLSSDGSTAMATCCATSVCLNNEYGEPLVSGITVGLINNKILVDLSAEEDDLSDCDLKIISDKNSHILGIFMDTKNIIDFKVFPEMLKEAIEGNKKIIKYLETKLSGYKELIEIKTGKIGSFVGKNGINIKDMQTKFNCRLKVFDNGYINLQTSDKKTFNLCKDIIMSFSEIKEDREITGLIRGIKTIDEKTFNINLGLFNFNIAKNKFKYEVFDIIKGIVKIEDKNINLTKIKKIAFHRIT